MPTPPKPEGHLKTQTYMVGSVDDSANCINDFTTPSQDVATLLHNAQHDAQSWNDHLDSSGGALEVRKCMFHLAHSQFTPRGAPVLQSFVPYRLSLQLQESGPHGTTVPIKYLQPTTYRKTLGCYKSPAGGYKRSLQAITENAMAKATLVAKSALDPKCTMRYYTSAFLPSVTYPLPTCSIPEKQLRKLHNQTAGLFLNRLGYSRLQKDEPLKSQSHLQPVLPPNHYHRIPRYHRPLSHLRRRLRCQRLPILGRIPKRKFLHVF